MLSTSFIQNSHPPLNRKASMDVDHSGTVTEAEARQALKNRIPPVTSAAGNGEKSMEIGSESYCFCEAEVDKLVQTLMGWGALQLLFVQKLVQGRTNECEELMSTRKHPVCLTQIGGDTGCVTYSRFMAEMIAAKKAGGMLK